LFLIIHCLTERDKTDQLIWSRPTLERRCIFPETESLD
jgi:hypothetical protein